MRRTMLEGICTSKKMLQMLFPEKVFQIDGRMKVRWKGHTAHSAKSPHRPSLSWRVVCYCEDNLKSTKLTVTGFLCTFTRSILHFCLAFILKKWSENFGWSFAIFRSRIRSGVFWILDDYSSGSPELALSKKFRSTEFPHKLTGLRPL